MSEGFTDAQKKELMKLPGFKEIKKQYTQAGLGKMKGKGKKMRGMGFWDDLWSGIKSAAKSVDSWLTRTKALSTAGKVIGAITAVIPGLQEVAPIALGAAKGAEAMGYGKKMRGGRKGLTANDLGQHVNAVAGKRGLVKQGMGSYTQDHQSQVYRALGTGTFPSHLQPFLTAGKIKGGSAGLAVGSIGNAVKPKF